MTYKLETSPITQLLYPQLVQEYALRRNAVRVLTFLAASGELGTATLMQVHVNQFAMKQTRASKEADNTCKDGNCPRGNPCEGSAGLLAKVGSAVCVNKDSSFEERVDKEKMVVKHGEKGCSTPWSLIYLLALELNVEEDEATSHSDKMSSAEDRCNSCQQFLFEVRVNSILSCLDQCFQSWYLTMTA